jgi:hypothetical protein
MGENYKAKREVVDSVVGGIRARMDQYDQGLISSAELLMTINEMFGSDVIRAIIEVHAVEDEIADER